MHKGFLVSGALFGALAVALGAFGAHGLERITTEEKIIHSFQTAVQYQMYHALALIAVAIIYERITSAKIKWAGNFFVTGIILFSGSLYALTAIKISGAPAFEKIGIITPVGGLFFIGGWLMLLFGVITKRAVSF